MSYIYERNPDTGEIFERKIGESHNSRKLIKSDTSMNMMSLYDYLGHAAGPELGQQVAKAASQARVKSEMREVSNPKYKGKIMLYPKAFLDLYFRNGLNEGTRGKQLLKG